MKTAMCAFFIFLLGLVVLSPQSAYADVYASNLRVTNPDSVSAFDGSFNDGTGVLLWYCLNDKADTVIVQVKSGATVIRTFTLTDSVSLARGEHRVVWNGKGNTVPILTPGSYTFSVRAVQKTGYSSYTEFFDSGGDAAGIFTRGVDVNRDPTSKNFGFMYAGNSSGSPMGQGILRVRADGKPAGGDTLGGWVIKRTLFYPNWGAGNNVYFATLDDLGRVYVSGSSTTLDIIRLDTSTVKQVAKNLKKPHGLYITGSGASRKIYVADGFNVLRLNIGDSDTLSTPPDTIAKLGTYIRDLIVDDSLYLYVNLRAGTETSLDGNSGQGLATEKYRITGTLPVTRADTLWSYAWPSSGGVRPNGIAIWRGSNLTSSVDDILYVSVVDDGTPGVRDGIWEFKNLSAKPPTVTQVYKPSGTFADISNRADLTVDAVGNIILFENNHEHIYFVSPPHGPNSYTTNSATGVFITVTVATGVDATDNSLPQEYSLSQNYPNPFNPSTTIEFKVPVAEKVRLAVYNILGQEVAVLVDEIKQAGTYRVVFDARNLASGTYFYALTTRDKFLKNKMVLLK